MLQLSVDAHTLAAYCGLMPSTRLPSSIFVVLVLLAGAQYLHYSPMLPEIMGSHFNRSGSVDSFQSKTAFFGIEVLIVALSALVGFLLPKIIAAMPVWTINLPNRGYWLSPEHRAETLGYLQVQMAWLGCALLAFLLLVMELVFRANLQTPPRLNSAAFVAGLVSFLAYVAVFTVRIVLRFTKIRP